MTSEWEFHACGSRRAAMERASSPPGASHRLLLLLLLLLLLPPGAVGVGAGAQAEPPNTGLAPVGSRVPLGGDMSPGEELPPGMPSSPLPVPSGSPGLQSARFISRGAHAAFRNRCSELRPSYKTHSLFGKRAVKAFLAAEGTGDPGRSAAAAEGPGHAAWPSPGTGPAAPSGRPATRTTVTFLESWLCDGRRAVSKRQSTNSETKPRENSG